jgi:hypothetical protein
MAELFPVDIGNKCRACHSDKPEELIRPCACAGPDEWAHAACLPSRHGSEKPDDTCDECGTPFLFEKNVEHRSLRAIVCVALFILAVGVGAVVGTAVYSVSFDVSIGEALYLVTGIIVNVLAFFLVGNYPIISLVGNTGGKCYEKPISRVDVLISVVYYTGVLPLVFIRTFQNTRTAAESSESGANAAGEDRFAGFPLWDSPDVSAIGIIGLLFMTLFIYYTMDRKVTTWTVVGRAPAKADDAA